MLYLSLRNASVTHLVTLTSGTPVTSNDDGRRNTADRYKGKRISVIISHRECETMLLLILHYVFHRIRRIIWHCHYLDLILMLLISLFYFRELTLTRSAPGRKKMSYRFASFRQKAGSLWYFLSPEQLRKEWFLLLFLRCFRLLFAGSIFFSRKKLIYRLFA